MPEIFLTPQPIQTDEGESRWALKTVTIDMELPLVKIVLMATDDLGAFKPNGKTINIRHEGVAASAILTSPTYLSVLSSVRSQLLAGSNLPEGTTLVEP